ncbi:unnamed protein product [Ilex paraguariensis]|uniref:Mannan endo-1,4-beta-mannosidase n=1 Tax=Ilex paraguariensis TaxID=185542 RepID=A0ABC8SDI8_9AQUA
MEFMKRWMSNHWQDSRTILKKPLVIAEFGKSSKDPGYSLNRRDWYMSSINTNIYNLARSGGTVGGALVWQLMAKGMDSYDDGYQIILSENPSTDGVIYRQCRAMAALSHIYGFSHWPRNAKHGHPYGRRPVNNEMYNLTLQLSSH